MFLFPILAMSSDHLKDPIVAWRKALGGYLVELQQHVFQHIKQLSSIPVRCRKSVHQAGLYPALELLLPLPQSYRELALPDQATLLKQYLDRPIRVCGVVPNTGDPGEGHFGSRTLRMPRPGKSSSNHRSIPILKPRKNSLPLERISIPSIWSAASVIFKAIPLISWSSSIPEPGLSA
ncbi:MAG: DUF4301 family protein [Nitrospirales bacterium]|nr:DUF4301 family protein [Nitrospirales bacterium]